MVALFIYLLVFVFFFFSHFELVLVKERELLKTGEATLYFSRTENKRRSSRKHST